jgi:hypothetical protein
MIFLHGSGMEMSVFPLSERERQELRYRLKELREIYARHPVPDELTPEQKKERMRRIKENRLKSSKS